jgi:hypothetical protein
VQLTVLSQVEWNDLIFCYPTGMKTTNYIS